LPYKNVSGSLILTGKIISAVPGNQCLVPGSFSGRKGKGAGLIRQLENQAFLGWGKLRAKP
jgi:hypothetical protein